MSTPTLATKLYIPPLRPRIVLRPRLVERLNEGLSAGRKLTLISASAGFGKTTLVSEWVAGCERPVAWLSLDEGDNDPTRFLAYLVAALQTIFAGIGAGVLAALQSPQPPPAEALLTALINEIAAIAESIVFVLDDYHVIEAKPVDHALAFLVEHLPPVMHLVIATREDPHLPLARLRARGQLTELRAADLRFTSPEAAEFLNQVMGWLKQLPDPLVRFRPVLSVDYASALMASGDVGAVEARLRDAERWLVTAEGDPMAGMSERSESPAAAMVVVDHEEYRRLPAMIALIRAAQALARGDMPETVKNARRVLDLAPEDDHLRLGGAASQLGLAAWASGDLEAARRMTADGMTHLRLAEYISPAIDGAIVLADIQIAQGCLHEAMTTYEQALQWATQPGASVLPGAADMYVGHTFRTTGITTYLQNGGTIEHAQQIANHESPRTTKLYDRTYDAISLDEIERILI